MNKNESLSDQVAALARGSQTALCLAEQSLARAKQHTDLNAFVVLDESIIFSQAEKSTRRRADNKALSPIDGVPIAIKDNYLTKDYPTTACSDAVPLEPKGADATIVANLRVAGAIIFGKTNMHEWAYGATNDTSNIGITRNPYNLDHITGGSSGGSGAAVASGIVAAALGSDTGGSVRIPSSACGIYGFKPTYGRASRYGILPLSWSLDAPGPMTSTLKDIHLLLPYFFGKDKNDASTAHARPYHSMTFDRRPQLINLKGPGFERSEIVDAAVSEALDNSGAVISEVGLENIPNYFAAWETILHCEASSYHNDRLKTNPAGFTAVTRAHLQAGQQLTGVELLEAQKLRQNLLHAILRILHNRDALILPTLPVTAPRHGDDWQNFGGRRVTTQDSMTWFCWIGNLAGLPCLTIPIAKSDDGLPIGMMLMGKPGRDEELLAIAKRLDDNINGNTRSGVNP